MGGWMDGWMVVDLYNVSQLAIKAYPDPSHTNYTNI